jgi:DNA recombination protein RmuC
VLTVWIAIGCTLAGVCLGWTLSLRRARGTLSDTFRALSADALHRNNQAFLQLATATLERFQLGARAELAERERAVDALVQPLRASLQRVDGVLGEMEKSRIAAYAALSEQLRGLVETQLPMLRGQTAALVQALRQPAVRGRWGEIQLRRVVEMAGMLEHCDFLEQPTRSSEERVLRPDLVVRLPGGKHLVIDAKAPLAAYLDANEAPDEETRASRLRAHAQQVREHMVALGRKAYWEQFSPSPEFVVMFLPGEMFFSAALQQDPALIEFGVNEKVLVATPTTLIALLRAAAYGWRQESLTANAEQVAQLGKELFTRIGVLARHWSEVGERLGKAVDAYNRSVVTLESRVLVSARRFRDLQAAAPDGQIDAQAPIELTPRALQAEELVEELVQAGVASAAAVSAAGAAVPESE